MKKTIRYVLRITGGILCLFLLAWLLLAGYIQLNKASLLKKAQTELKARVGGEVSIGNMDISYFRHFPYITLQLSTLSLRDSAWPRHHHDLLQAGNLYLRFALFRSLLDRKVRVSKVFLEQASIYLFTDSTGYSNDAMLRKDGGTDAKKDTAGSAGPANGPEKGSDAEFPDISLTDCRVVVDKQDRNKLFDFTIHSFDCHIEKDKRSLMLQINTSMQVNSLAFNTERGSFIKDNSLAGRFYLVYNPKSHIIQGNKVALQIGGHNFLFSGRFFPSVSPDPFFLSIQTDGILYRQATALLTPALKEKLDQYDIDKPVSLNAILDAGSADDHTPLISVRMDLVNGNVSTPIGRFSGASFRSSFTNEWARSHKREDENSAVRLLAFSGDWEGIPLRSDTVTILNLKRPQLDCDLRSKFKLARINELAGSKTIQFQHGDCSLAMSYKGPLMENDSTVVSLNGSIELDSVAAIYLPYRFTLTNGSGKLRFKDQDLVMDRLEAEAGSSRILVRGVAHNLASIVDKVPKSITMDWSVTSSHLDLGDLAPLAGRPAEPVPAKTGKNPFGATASRIDQVLRDGSLHLQLEAADLRYKKFYGAHAKAELLFSGYDIRLDKMILEQGSGTLTMSGSLRRPQQGTGNPFQLQSHLEKVDLPRVFTAFNNFGQDALRDKNLKGSLTADIRMTGLLTDKAVLVKNSLKGAVDFSIREGQLIGFGPMEKIQEKVLKKKDLSEIHFAELKNQLDLDTTTLTIHRMEIRSTAFTLFVEGIYDMKKGADLSLQIPLSNLKKDRSPDAPPVNNGNDGKAGISIRLRAKTGDGGKLKISWDPFRKAARAKPAKVPNASRPRKNGK